MRIALAIAAVTTALFTPVAAAQASTHEQARVFANCTALHRVYRHGVGLRGAHDHVTSGTPVTNFTRNGTVYRQNKGKDRDHDGIACEKH
jgi:hypothetical protein